MGYTNKQQILGMSAYKLAILCIDPLVTQQQEVLSNCLASSLALGRGGVYSPIGLGGKELIKHLMPVSGYIIAGAKQCSRHG